jgi:hypothetical protein
MTTTTLIIESREKIYTEEEEKKPLSLKNAFYDPISGKIHGLFSKEKGIKGLLSLHKKDLDKKASSDVAPGIVFHELGHKQDFENPNHPFYKRLQPIRDKLAKTNHKISDLISVLGSEKLGYKEDMNDLLDKMGLTKGDYNKFKRMLNVTGLKRSLMPLPSEHTASKWAKKQMADLPMSPEQQKSNKKILNRAFGSYVGNTVSTHSGLAFLVSHFLHKYVGHKIESNVRKGKVDNKNLESLHKVLGNVRNVAGITSLASSAAGTAFGLNAMKHLDDYIKNTTPEERSKVIDEFCKKPGNAQLQICQEPVEKIDYKIKSVASQSLKK